MKNYIFIGGVIFILTLLFTLRYAVGILDDNTLKIALITTLLVTLIVRNKLGINFFKG